MEKAGTPATRITTTASCTIEKVANGFRITRMRLEVRGEVPGVDQAAFAKAAEAAKEGCPVSQALKGNVPLRAGREAGIDPVCHTLVGAGLARSGLAQADRIRHRTLLIGANLPDVDVLAYLWGPGADLAFRRGWTHGVLALALWPLRAERRDAAPGPRRSAGSVERRSRRAFAPANCCCSPASPSGRTPSSTRSTPTACAG